MALALIILFVIGAAAVAFLIFRSMLGQKCPYCVESGSGNGLVVPVIPGIRFWCAQCSRPLTSAELEGRSLKEDPLYEERAPGDYAGSPTAPSFDNSNHPFSPSAKSDDDLIDIDGF